MPCCLSLVSIRSPAAAPGERLQYYNTAATVLDREQLPICVITDTQRFTMGHFCF